MEKKILNLTFCQLQLSTGIKNRKTETQVMSSASLSLIQDKNREIGRLYEKLLSLLSFLLGRTLSLISFTGQTTLEWSTLNLVSCKEFDQSQALVHVII